MSVHIQIVQAVFKSFIDDQSVDCLLANVTDDVLFQNSAPGTVPFGGDFHGRAGILDYFARLAPILEPHSVRAVEYFESEDQVVVLGDEVLRVLATGEEFPSVWCTVFTFRDDLISRVRVIEDHSPVVPALVREV